MTEEAERGSDTRRELFQNRTKSDKDSTVRNARSGFGKECRSVIHKLCCNSKQRNGPDGGNMTFFRGQKSSRCMCVSHVLSSLVPKIFCL